MAGSALPLVQDALYTLINAAAEDLDAKVFWGPSPDAVPARVIFVGFEEQAARERNILGGAPSDAPLDEEFSTQILVQVWAKGKDLQPTYRACHALADAVEALIRTASATRPPLGIDLQLFDLLPPKLRGTFRRDGNARGYQIEITVSGNTRI